MQRPLYFAPDAVMRINGADRSTGDTDLARHFRDIQANTESVAIELPFIVQGEYSLLRAQAGITGLKLDAQPQPLSRPGLREPPRTPPGVVTRR